MSKIIIKKKIYLLDTLRSATISFLIHVIDGKRNVKG